MRQGTRGRVVAVGITMGLSVGIVLGVCSGAAVGALRGDVRDWVVLGLMIGSGVGLMVGITMGVVLAQRNPRGICRECGCPTEDPSIDLCPECGATPRRETTKAGSSQTNEDE